MSEDVKYRIRESEYDALVTERDHFMKAWSENTRRLHEVSAQVDRLKDLLRECIHRATPDWDFVGWHDRVCSELIDRTSTFHPDEEGLRVRKNPATLGAQSDSPQTK